MTVLALAVAALLTAGLSAMAGLGGGTVLIGVLLASGMAPALALVLHAGVQLASNGSRSVAYHAHIHWRSLGLFSLGALPGPFVVAPLVVGADPDWVRLLLALFIVLCLWPAWTRRLRIHSGAGLLIGGVLVGLAGPVVGATGMIAAPFFLRDDWRKENVIATLAAAQSGAHGFKIVAFWANGSALFSRLDLLLPMVAAVILGTFIGRRLNGLFSEHRFRWVFRALLAVLAIKLGWDGVSGL